MRTAMSAQMSSLVVSKLDRLSGKAQRLVKLATVIGTVFSSPLLTRLAQRGERGRLARRASGSTSMSASTMSTAAAAATATLHKRRMSESTSNDDLSDTGTNYREDEVMELLDELCSRNWLRHVADGQYRFVDDKQRQIVYELLLFEYRQHCKCWLTKLILLYSLQFIA